MPRKKQKKEGKKEIKKKKNDERKKKPEERWRLFKFRTFVIVLIIVNILAMS